jgi:hypothetical protein
MPNIERANMPEISSAAHKTLSERPGYIKQHIKQTSKKKVIKACKTCNKQYDQTEADQIIADLPIISDFDYVNQCLKCLQKNSHTSKEIKHPELKELRQELNKITIIYQKSLNKWKAVSKQYQELDYQEKMLSHHMTKLVKTSKTSTPKKTKTREQIKQTTAMKILSNLSEEQQAAILAIMMK